MFAETILRSPDANDDDFFGSPVEFFGDRLIVGASGDDECANNAGAGYVYRRVGGAWQVGQKLMASDCEAAMVSAGTSASPRASSSSEPRTKTRTGTRRAPPMSSCTRVV
jgi:hypothetical protein